MSFHAAVAPLSHDRQQRISNSPRGGSDVYDPDRHKDFLERLWEEGKRAAVRPEIRFTLWWAMGLAQLRTTGTAEERKWAAEELCHPEMEQMWEEARDLGARVDPYPEFIELVREHLVTNTPFIPSNLAGIGAEALTHNQRRYLRWKQQPGRMERERARQRAYYRFKKERGGR